MTFTSKFLVVAIILSSIFLSSDGKSFKKIFYIINGYVPKIQTFAKYIVSVRKGRNFKTARHHCSGTIFTDRIVISAAHCFFNKKNKRVLAQDLYVVAGEPKLLKNVLKGRVRRITKILPHPKYTHPLRVHDLALLYLERPLKEDDVNIERAPWSKIAPKAGEICTTLGWGKTLWGGNNSVELKNAKVKILDSNSCQRSTSQRVEDGLLCSIEDEAIEGAGHACRGDSGSPLICNDDRVHGIVSFSKKLCDSPTFYTDVTRYLNWAVIQARDFQQQTQDESNTKRFQQISKNIITYLVILISITFCIFGLLVLMLNFNLL